MKQMTCAQMGGPATCSFAISGNTAEEMAKNGGDHLMTTTDEDHKEAREMMKNSTPEAQAKWMDEFKAKFDAAPTV